MFKQENKSNGWYYIKNDYGAPYKVEFGHPCIYTLVYCTLNIQAPSLIKYRNEFSQIKISYDFVMY